MPIYEFVCQDCGNEFEKIQSFSDTTVPSCLSCNSDEVARRVGRPAIHFKGNGWYITDSKKKAGKNGASVNGSSENGAAKETGDSATSQESGGETKAAKSDDASKADSGTTTKTTSESPKATETAS